jgi:hypothetical protein
MIDVEKYQAYPGPANNPRNYLSCGAPAEGTSPPSPAIKGSVWCWADTYVWQLGGQYFRSGWGRWPGTGSSRHVHYSHHSEPALYRGVMVSLVLSRIQTAFCHQLPELNYGNNISEIQIDIPDHPGKQGVAH